ncbi:MAG: chorismate mutase [Thermoleophilia bacterium]
MTSGNPGTDPVVQELRDRIDAVDRELLAGLNRRLRLVGELKLHKEAQGYSFTDAGREERLLEGLRAANGGPLSAEGVDEIFRTIVARTKRDVYGP